MFHANLMNYCRTNPFAAHYQFTPHEKVKVDEPKDIMSQFVDDATGELDPVMQEKIHIIESRPIRGFGKKSNVKKTVQIEEKQKPKPIPGMKLMKKLHKEHQLEKSLHRVIKNLV